MPDQVKMLISEINGQELEYHSELSYHAQTQPFDPTGSPFTASSTEGAIKESISLSGVALSLLQMGYSGNAGTGKYLQVFAGNSSSDSPFVVARPAEVVAVSFSNKNVTMVDIGLYKGQTLIHTLTITNSNVGHETLTTPINLSPGDLISAKIISGSSFDATYVVTLKGGL